MVEISLSGSGEGPGWVTAPGYSTTAEVQNVMRRSTAVTRRAGGRCWDHVEPGTSGTNLSRLKSNGLIEQSNDGVRLSDALR